MKQREDWNDYLVTVGGVTFRPVSMATLAILYEIGSPLVYGGEVTAIDYCVFAWIHQASIIEVLAAVKSNTIQKKSIIWASEVEPVIFTSYTNETIAKLADDLKKVFIEEKTGFIPFPLPLQHRRSWLKRVMTGLRHLFSFG